MPTRNYRADIDGLRALAVLLVVFYHARFPIPGGFIGVDVFFVISGFLITRILDTAISHATFTYTQFYFKRVKRLLPALFFMLVAVSAWCSVLFLPDDLLTFAKTAVRALLGISNVYFYKHTNYFETTSFQPLLHTWSLAVEEQFYLFWPVILLALNKARRPQRKTVVFSLLFIGSVLWSWYWVTQDKNFAYLMLPGRIFELMAGALLATGYSHLARLASWRNTLSVTGLALILSSAFLLNADSPFPGLAALPVTLGSVMVIRAEGGIVNRLLATKPLVYVGKVSYSFYLWHWPFIVLALYQGKDLTFGNASLLIFGAFIAACISYHLVETPLRQLRSPRRVFALLYLLPLCCTLLFQTGMKVSGGMRWRTAGLVDELDTKNTAHVIRSACIGKMKVGNVDECYLGVKKAQPDAILIGDSFSNAAAPFIDILAKDAGLMITDTARSNTPSLSGIYVRNKDSKLSTAEIKKVVDYTRKRVEYAKKLKKVIISDHYSLYDTQNPHFLVFDAQGKQINHLLFEQRKQLIHELLNAGVKVILLAQPFRALDRHLIAQFRAKKMQHAHLADVRVSSGPPRTERVEYRLKQFFPQIQLIDMNDVLCDQQSCSPFIDGDIIYRTDGTHLNYSSSAKIGQAYLQKKGNPLKEE